MSSRVTNSRSQTQAAPEFRKGACCPSSEELLQYCQDTLPPFSGRCAELDRHLANCDFCSAELQLLAAYPPHLAANECIPAIMPIHLYALASVLLANSGPTAEGITASVSGTTSVMLIDV